MLLTLEPGACSALLIVDMQAFFFRQPERRKHLPMVTANINRLIAAFDALDWPVVHCITAYRADGSDWDLKMKASGVPELIAGSSEAAVLPEICVTDRHWVVPKTRYSAFFKTNLSERLKARAVRRVVVTGAYTHYCVNATVFDAYCCDFVPGIATDAVLSHLEAESQMIVARMVRNGYHVFSTDEYLHLLGERSKGAAQIERPERPGMV